MAGKILVAILNQGSFDVTQVDRTSLRFGPEGPSDQSLRRAHKKSAGTCRVVIGKTERGTPLNFALITEGAPYEGRKVPPTA
jgi:hypothetical protein